MPVGLPPWHGAAQRHCLGLLRPILRCKETTNSITDKSKTATTGASPLFCSWETAAKGSRKLHSQQQYPADSGALLQLSQFPALVESNYLSAGTSTTWGNTALLYTAIKKFIMNPQLNGLEASQKDMHRSLQPLFLLHCRNWSQMKKYWLLINAIP